MIDVVERTASEVFVPLTVGGGLRTVEDVRELLLAGADTDYDQHGGHNRSGFRKTGF